MLFSCALGRLSNFKMGPLLTLFSTPLPTPFWLDLSKIIFIVISASLIEKGNKWTIWPPPISGTILRSCLCLLDFFAPAGKVWTLLIGNAQTGTKTAGASKLQALEPAQSTKFLDNKICSFEMLLWRRFPRKNSILDYFPLCPQCALPPQHENFIFIVVSPSLRVLKVPRTCHFGNHRFWYPFVRQRTTQTGTKIVGAPKLWVLTVPRTCDFETHRFWCPFVLLI